MNTPISFNLIPAICGLFLVLMSTAAPGSEQTVSSDAEVAVFTGTINQERVNSFLKEYADKQVRSLRINSSGGEVLAAIRLGRWVRSRGLAVQVRTICMSSCANYVFSAGGEKIIEPGSIVVWHGSTEQKNIREEQSQFELLDGTLSNFPRDNAERAQLETRRPRYLLIQKQREQQAQFLKELDMDDSLFRLGQEPVAIADAWTSTVAVMSKYGLTNVRAPSDYGSAHYLKSNPLVHMLFKSKLASFDIDAQGAIIPITLGPDLPYTSAKKEVGD